MMPDEDSDERLPSACLPFWRRFLFATVLPLLAVYCSARLWVHFVLTDVPIGSLRNAGMAGAIVWLLVGLMPVVICAPFVLFLAGTACLVKWKRRWTAFGGGLLRVMIGIGCGAIVIALLMAK